jgi:hypothetical protein
MSNVNRIIISYFTCYGNINKEFPAEKWQVEKPPG